MTPLHQAVIDNDCAFVAKHLDSLWRHASDSMGFTPLELAQLLGREECLKLFRQSLPSSIKVQAPGESSESSLLLKDFENFFHLKYRSSLCFSSYRLLKQVIRECPYIMRNRWIASENYTWTQVYQQELASGILAPMAIKWIDKSIGYGAFADVDLNQGTFIGEYTGIVKRLYRKHPDHNEYCFHYPTRFWSLKYFAIDAMREGNLLRFVNHSSNPNLQPLCLIDRGLLHLVFVSNQPIAKGTELRFDYGQDFWSKRKTASNSV